MSKTFQGCSKVPQYIPSISVKLRSFEQSVESFEQVIDRLSTSYRQILDSRLAFGRILCATFGI